MENIRKIKHIIPLLYILQTGTFVEAQNYYNSTDVYYNMDTVNCLSEARDFFAGWDVLAPMPDIEVDTFYNVYKMTLNIPLLEIKDSNLHTIIEECLKESLNDGTILFPDTSGYFVYVLLEPDSLSLQYKMKVDPTSNYYMYDMLTEPRRQYSYITIGCFYHDAILCIVQSCCSGEDFDDGCLWEKTNFPQKIKIYQQELEYMSEYYGPVFYYSIKKCESQGKR